MERMCVCCDQKDSIFVVGVVVVVGAACSDGRRTSHSPVASTWGGLPTKGRAPQNTIYIFQLTLRH